MVKCNEERKQSLGLETVDSNISQGNVTIVDGFIAEEIVAYNELLGGKNENGWRQRYSLCANWNLNIKISPALSASRNSSLATYHIDIKCDSFCV